ncbi:MAG: hypothetical protein KJ901_21765 [Gammaproteobacteria bacterium]|nr:hypothetical protein [Gammaproteobacteria bacterium]MBU1440217.1 hypothetical protein [Gammaproteobacteria bacterium]
MDIAVVISGVADPKWPLPADTSIASLQTHLSKHAALSPFDEAALELSLALRDAHADIRVVALVAGDEALARRVAGWRPDTLCRIDLDAVPRWDGIAVSAALALALAQQAPDATLVIVGREFGDFDDGTVPAALAGQTGRIALPLVLGVRRTDAGNGGATFDVLRQGNGGLERVALAGPALLAATNDPGNRLRHPLMKNVMLAKKAAIDVWSAPAPAASDRVQLESIHTATEPVRTTACQWLEGSPAQQAHALADWLVAEAQA